MTRQQHLRRVATLCIYSIKYIAFKREERTELLNRPGNEFFEQLMVTFLIYVFPNGANYLAIKIARITGKVITDHNVSSLVYLRR